MLLYPISFAHGPFNMQEQYDSAGASVPAKWQDTVIVDRRRIRSGYRDLRSPYHLAQGGSGGRVHKGFTAIELSGRILVPDASQPASLSDRERAFLAAFDPDLCYRDSPTTDGVYAFDFTEPTTLTGIYTNGRIPLRYYARPADKPIVDETHSEAGVRPFQVALLCPDPRMYEQAETTLVLSPGTPSGDVVNNGTVRAPLKVTIVVSGAGNAAFTITRSGVAFVIDLTGLVASDIITIVMETCGPYGRGKYVTKTTGGVTTEVFSRKTSSPSTWLDAPVGTTSFAISNHTNVTSCTLAWRSARA